MASMEEGRKSGEGRPPGDLNGTTRGSGDYEKLETSPQTSAFQSAVAAWRSKGFLFACFADWVESRL